MPKNKENRKRQLALNKSNKNVKIPMKIEKKCNWDNLPNELKVKCIERTDFKTRANLMLSNRHNKMLVESIKSKYQLSYVYFKDISCYNWSNISYENSGFVVKSWRSTADYTSNKYEQRKLVDVLLNANIELLEFKCVVIVIDSILPDVLATCNKKFSVKSLHITATHRIGLDILQRCDEQLEKISVDYNKSNYCCYDLSVLLGIPQVIAAKRLTILLFSNYVYYYEGLKTVIDWLLVEVDHDIGKEIIFQYEKPYWKDWWQSSWQFLVCMTDTERDFHHPTEKIIRLRPSNPSKRVWAWQSKKDESYNFLVSAAGSDAPNIEEIEKKRTKERKEHELRTRL